MTNSNENIDFNDPIALGRLNRLSFIAWLTVSIVCCVFLIFIVLIVSGETIPFFAQPANDPDPAISPVLAIIKTSQLFLIISHVFISIRRAHDIGINGWWVILLFMPIFNL